MPKVWVVVQNDCALGASLDEEVARAEVDHLRAQQRAAPSSDLFRLAYIRTVSIPLLKAKT